MGLGLLIFHNDEWHRLYVENCSLRTPEEWNAEGNQVMNHTIGIVYIIIGVICELLYIPFMIAMLKPEFIRHSCYKFMFLLAIIDMIALPCDSFISGVQGLLGQHYCANPLFYYLVGCGSIGGYLGATMTCIVLAIDRFFEVLFPRAAVVLFGGYRVYLWMLIPIAYTIHTLNQIPAFYSISHQAFYYDPFYGTPGFEGNAYFKQLTFLVTNSVLTVIFMGGIYGVLCAVLIYRAKFSKNAKNNKHNTHMTKLQRVMLLQSFAICIEMFVVAVVYVGNQFYWVPEFVVKIEHLTWICTHGDTPLVYLLLNASLRKSFFKMIKKFFRGTNNTTSVVFLKNKQSSTQVKSVT